MEAFSSGGFSSDFLYCNKGQLLCLALSSPKIDVAICDLQATEVTTTPRKAASVQLHPKILSPSTERLQLGNAAQDLPDAMSCPGATSCDRQCNSANYQPSRLVQMWSACSQKKSKVRCLDNCQSSTVETKLSSSTLGKQHAEKSSHRSPSRKVQHQLVDKGNEERKENSACLKQNEGSVKSSKVCARPAATPLQESNRLENWRALSKYVCL